MKKVLLLVALTLALTSLSQPYPPSGTVTILGTEPKEMCDGDSMQVNFKFIFSGINDTVVKHTFYVWKSPFGFYLVGNFNYNDFYHLHKNLVGSDTVYSFKFYYSSINGKAYGGMAINYPLGHHSVCINAQASCVNIHVFECIEPNGINKYRPDNLKPVYYDLYGNIIEPRKNEIIIEKTGDRRRKIVIQ